MTEYEVEQLKATLAAQGSHKQSSVMDQLVEVCRTNFGEENFDRAAEVVVSKLGQERADVLRRALPSTNNPGEIITHLESNPNRLESMAKMSQDDFVFEIARIEAERGPRTAHGNEPAWMNQAKHGGRVSDARWAATGGDELSDRAWHREFDRRMAARSKLRDR
jgi:hypothetical protein